MSTPVWAVHFHPRDRHSHCGYTRYIEATREDMLKTAKDAAGNSYTFTFKQSSATKPHNPKRNHARPA